MGAMASEITVFSLFAQPFVQTQIKENTKAPRHWLLWGNPPVAGGFPYQGASNTENDSIWWRYHVPRKLPTLYLVHGIVFSLFQTTAFENIYSHDSMDPFNLHAVITNLKTDTTYHMTMICNNRM